MPASFHFLGASHIIVLMLTCVIAAGMIALARGGWRGITMAERVLALLLLLEWPANVVINSLIGQTDRGVMLPGHLCDVAALIGGFALLTHKPLLCELLYFWGLAGTLQGMITPALAYDFPNARFFMFFEVHMCVVIAAFYIVLGARITPRRGASLRALGLLLVYGFVAGLVNFLLGTNYGFLCEKPFVGSVADYLGPWPWYIGSMALVGAVFFTLLDAPFWWGRRCHQMSLHKREHHV